MGMKLNYNHKKRDLDYCIQTNFNQIKFENEEDKKIAHQGVKNFYTNFISTVQGSQQTEATCQYSDKDEMFVLKYTNRTVTVNAIDLCGQFEENFLSTANRPDLFNMVFENTTIG